MSEFDPNILNRNLPQDIHALIGQVNANVTTAVRKLVDEFRASANNVADQFERRDFSAELKTQLEAIKSDLTEDLGLLDDSIKELGEAADKAKRASTAAGAAGAELGPAVDTLVSQSKLLDARLKAFRQKVNTFAEKSGGLIAKAAIKTFTGGIG